ncbi:MAG: hypothetical protein RIF33_13500 [Cyclobacteriaceae bacterium]
MKQDNIEILLNQLLERVDQHSDSLEKISEKIDSVSALDIYNDLRILKENNKTKLDQTLTRMGILNGNFKTISTLLNRVRVELKEKSNVGFFETLTQNPQVFFFNLALTFTVILMGIQLFEQMNHIDDMKDSYYKYEMTKYYDNTLEEIEEAYEKDRERFQSGVDSLKSRRNSK